MVKHKHNNYLNSFGTQIVHLTQFQYLKDMCNYLEKNCPWMNESIHFIRFLKYLSTHETLKLIPISHIWSYNIARSIKHEINKKRQLC